MILANPVKELREPARVNDCLAAGWGTFCQDHAPALPWQNLALNGHGRGGRAAQGGGLLSRPWRLTSQNNQANLESEGPLTGAFLSLNSHRGGAVPRINVEERVWSDPRLVTLTAKVGTQGAAIGELVRFWRYAQEAWLEQRLITASFFQKHLCQALLEAGFAEETPDGIRCLGAEEHFGWLKQRRDAGRKGGLQTQLKRRSSDAQAVLKQIEASSSSSSSSSLSSNSFLTNESPIPRARKIALSAVGDWENLTPEKIALWGKSFPGVEVKAEIAKAAAWAIANPKNKKSNWERFLVNWLTRSQDHARPGNVTQLSDYEKTLAYAKKKDREAGRIA